MDDAKKESHFDKCSCGNWKLKNTEKCGDCIWKDRRKEQKED